MTFFLKALFWRNCKELYQWMQYMYLFSPIALFILNFKIDHGIWRQKAAVHTIWYLINPHGRICLTKRPVWFLLPVLCMAPRRSSAFANWPINLVCWEIQIWLAIHPGCRIINNLKNNVGLLKSLQINCSSYAVTKESFLESMSMV